jgi:hypothetical protein
VLVVGENVCVYGPPRNLSSNLTGALRPFLQ